MPFQYYEISTLKVMLFAFKAFKPQNQGFFGGIGSLDSLTCHHHWSFESEKSRVGDKVEG